MSRNLTTDLKNRLTAATTTPCFLWRADFDSFTLRLWSGAGDLTWDSQTWLGNGWLQGFDGASEQVEVASTGASVKLAGVPQDIISLILNAKHGAPGKFYLGALDTDGDIIADPYLVFAGQLDVPTILDDPGSPEITITYESLLVDLDRSREFRYNTESQKTQYPSDRGFEYASSAALWTGTWSNKKVDVRKKKPVAKSKRGAKK